MKLLADFTKGIIKENPICALMLGLCPALAISTSVENAIGMGAAATFVLLGSNLIVSFIRRAIPPRVRIPTFIIIIATFTTLVERYMYAYFPSLHQSLGIFLPLIVVNCIILARAEMFASKNPVINSIMDALGLGLGFTLALIVISSIREILGNATWCGINLFDKGFEPCLVMLLPPGAFITVGLLMGLINKLRKQ